MGFRSNVLLLTVKHVDKSACSRSLHKNTDSKQGICQHGGGSVFGIYCRVLNAEFFAAVGGGGSVLGIQRRVLSAEFSKNDVW